MATKVQIVFYSLYGHIYHMAQAVAEGAKSAGAEVEVYQVAETLSPEILQKMGATEAKKAFAHVPIADPKKLAQADAIILGSGTRFGGATAQMRAFIDATGSLWQSGGLVGKVASAFTSTASQHGGQETTLTSLHTFFFHQGMIVAGVPYNCQELLNMKEMTGGTPYGASTITAADGSRMPTANELTIARYQGKFVAEIATKLKG